jgi:hypothetical protein
MGAFMGRKTSIIGLAVALILVLAGMAFAWPIPDTGQTKCYSVTGEIPCPQPGELYYGQDGNYSANPMSFTKLDANGNPLPDSSLSWLMVRDNVTGLIWAVKQNKDGVKNYSNPHDADNTYTWYDSNPATNGGNAGTPGDGTDTEDFIKALNDANFGGHSDWRMPTRKEMHTIMDYSSYQNPPINITFFPDADWASRWWTSDSSGAEIAWFVRVVGKDEQFSKSGYYYVRAVRGVQSLNQFINNGDGTVTDTFTGLMWQQDSAPGTYNWRQALSYCEDLNLADHSDWRLPTIKELDSIVNLSRNPSIDITFFPDLNWPYRYWSSTTDARWSGGGWMVDFDAGFTSEGYSKYFDYKVRAVRGGLPGPLGDSVILRGKVIARDALGNILGPLQGVTVGTGSGGSITTDSTGGFLIDGLSAGSVTITANKTGFYPATINLSVRPGDNSQKVIYMTAQPEEGGTKPATVGFISAQGLHFIAGMPGELGLEATVAWNGSPGAVRFLVGGSWYEAVTQDIGGGLVRATVSIPIPTTLLITTEVRMSVSNGEGQTAVSATGIFFYPIPEILSLMSDILPVWEQTGKTYSSDTEIAIPFWSFKNPSGVLESKAYLGYHQKFGLDPLSGTLVIGLNGFVEASTTLEIADIENLTGARGDLTASGTWFLRGSNTPRFEGNVEIAGTMKSGVGAPAVYLLNLVLPPGAVSTALKFPVIGNILKALRLRLFLIGGLGLNGTWAENRNCWFGTESIGGSITLGAEVQALIEKWGAEVGVYLGGTGTPDFDFCPERSFNGVTIRGYLGVFASANLYEFSQEFGYEMALGAGGSTQPSSQPMRIVPLSTRTTIGWQPIGQTLLKWGTPNRLARFNAILPMSAAPLADTSLGNEEKLVENVFGLASPTMAGGAGRTMIVFAMHDANKPWHAATDIAQVVIPEGDAAGISRITDDLTAEFSPRLGKIDSDTLLAVWSRVAGDVSQTESPEQVSAHLEIAAAHYSRTTGTWGPASSLTDNTVTDRDPLPVHFGSTQGVVWVQNQGESTSGTPTTGYRLMYSAWTDSVWTTPVALWADEKSILDVSFAADDAGQGHIVFSVDEDGDADTLSDRELYHVQTLEGIWQAATRVTNNSLEDTIPVLVAPAGSPLCVWRQGEDLVYARVGEWTPKTVYARYTAANSAPSLAGVTLPGGAAIAYTVQGPEGIDIFTGFYDALLDKWSLPRQLTRDENAESALSLDFDGTDLIMAYLKTITERSAKDVDIDGQTYHIENVPSPGRTDLYMLKHRLGYDLAVSAEAVSFEPENPVPGNSATIKAAIENRGDLPVETVTTRFYLGNPDSGGTLIGEASTTEPLIPGDSRSVEVNWSVPQAPTTRVITVVVDPALAIDDRDRSNNTAQISACKPDIAVDQAMSNPLGPSKRMVTISVANHGTVPATDIPVIVTRGGAPDQVLHQASIDSLPVGATYDVAFELETSGEATDNGYLILNAMANAERTIDETTYTNNARPLQVQGAVPGKTTNPSVASGSVDVSLLPVLDWDDAAGATRYDLYLWKASEDRPDSPTVSGLTSSQYTLSQPLTPSTEYRWQVVAKNESGETPSDEWLFTTKKLVSGDINDDGFVNLTDAVLALQITVGMEPGQIIYEAADINGDGKIGMGEIIYILQKVAGLR